MLVIWLFLYGLGGVRLSEYERKEIIMYLINNTPMVLDLEKEDLKYDVRDIHYKIYKYIKELEERNGK